MSIEEYLLDSRYSLKSKKYINPTYLSHGGFGVAYVSEDSELKRKVLVKEFFPIESLKDYGNIRNNKKELNIPTILSFMFEDNKDKFLEEARKTAKLNHTNIVEVIEIFEENNTAYIVYKFFENSMTLNKFVKDYGEKISVEIALGIIKDILNAMDYTHSQDIIHRDLNPNNVLIKAVGKKLEIKIIDFGISKNKSSSSNTLLAMFPGYGAPEQQIRGMSGIWNDIYSIGALLFLLITKQSPPVLSRDEEEKEAEINKKSGKLVEYLTKVMKDKVEDEIINIIIKSMRYNHQERFKSVKEFLSQITNYEYSKVRQGEYKKCPYCYEEIKLEAIKCKHCNEFLNNNVDNKEENIIHNYNDLIGLGNDYYNKGLYDKAIEYYLKSIEINPKNDSAYYNLGHAYYNKGLIIKSIEFYKKVIEIDPNNPQYANIYTMLGKICKIRNFYDKAIEYYLKAINLKPDYDSAYNALGVVYENKGFYDKAIEYYLKAIEIAPNNESYREKFKLANEKIKNERKAEIIIKPVDKIIVPDTFVYIQGGTFKMGSNDGELDEKPVHSVTVSSFYIGKYEVTQKEYKDVMANNPSHFKGDNLPVETVSFYDAVEFCNKYNQMKGLPNSYDISGNLRDERGNSVTDPSKVKGYRLPTEAEWEFSARGGNKSNGYKYSGSNNVDDVAWYYNNSYDKGASSPDYGTHEVGTKRPNELGIYDMSGNVWEWISDCYDKDYYSKSPSNNPYNNVKSSFQVSRGGSWVLNANNLRVAFRFKNTPSYRYGLLGFRLLRSE